MPKVYNRNCDWCGEPYEGYGERFCGLTCSQNHRKAEHGYATGFDEEIHVDLDEEFGEIAVYASERINSAEKLMARAEVDLNEWEVVSQDVRTNQTPMKIEDRPMIVQTFYVAVKLRKKIPAHEFIRTVQIKVRPKEFSQAPSGFFTSVHWGDRHYPYNDPRNDDILFQILDLTEPRLVADHGDTMDCEEISVYPKNPWNRVGLGDEIKGAARFLGEVHALTPDARHLFLEGNHEERLKRVVWKTAEKRQIGEILTLPGVKERLSWPSLLGIDDLGWDYVPYPRHELLWDKLILCHGNYVRKDSGSSARAEYASFGKSGLSGHTHRRAAFHHTDYNGVHTWYEMGMLGSVQHAEAYVKGRADWQNGLMVISWSEDRQEWGPEPVPIHEGVAYFRGMRLEGSA